MSESSEWKYKQGTGHTVPHKSYKAKKSSNENIHLDSKFSSEKRRVKQRQSSDGNHNNGDYYDPNNGGKTYKSRLTSKSHTAIPKHKDERNSLSVRVSCIEIFNEEYRDMLSSDPSARLKVIERPEVSSYIKGLTTLLANDADDIDDIITIGNKNRIFGATALKPQKSSHAVYTITTGSNSNVKRSKKATAMSHFHFIDLAGRGEQIKMKAIARLPKEGGKINLPLSSLANTFSVVSSFSSSMKIQYRKSVLLKALGGLIEWNRGTDSRTLSSMEKETFYSDNYETKNDLLYCSSNKKRKIFRKTRRFKKKSKADKKDALIRRYQKEIEYLHEQLNDGDGPEQTDPEEDYSRLQAEEIDLSQKLEQMQSMIRDALLEQKEARTENQQKMKGILNNLHHLNKELCLQENQITAHFHEKYMAS